MHPLHEVQHIDRKRGEFMKRYFITILAVLILGISGCSSENHSNESQESEPPVTTEIQQKPTEPSQNETSTEGEIPTHEERSDEENILSESVSSRQLIITSMENTPESVEPSSPNTTEKPKTEQIVSEPAKENDHPPKETVSTQNESKPFETPGTDTSAESSEPAEDKATAADAERIAVKLAEYINEYRAEQGVSDLEVLHGLTEYAEYRSKQLVSNFAHDTNDERAAATALKYGEYIDPTLYGMTGDPYYTVNAREAIAKADYSGTVDNVAKRFAALVRNSSDHWNYVGGEKYCYIGIGITYEGGTWYCDIAVTRVNTDN